MAASFHVVILSRGGDLLGARVGVVGRKETPHLPVQGHGPVRQSLPHRQDNDFKITGEL